MAKPGVTGLPELKTKLNIWLQRAEKITLDKYRGTILAIFVEILKQTPQWSGAAVANWRIGIGAPDTGYETDVGDKEEIHLANHGQNGRSYFAAEHVKGDNGWIQYAYRNNYRKVNRITRLTDKVYITNNTIGDTDHMQSKSRYMESLQDRDYWKWKLRAINKPYEVAAETVIKMMDETTKHGLNGSMFAGFEIGTLDLYKHE